jgi:hypothetical protein
MAREVLLMSSSSCSLLPSPSYHFTRSSCNRVTTTLCRCFLRRGAPLSGFFGCRLTNSNSITQLFSTKVLFHKQAVDQFSFFLLGYVHFRNYINYTWQNSADVDNHCILIWYIFFFVFYIFKEKSSVYAPTVSRRHKKGWHLRYII